MKRIKIEMLYDSPYNEFKKHDIGYIVGYTYNGSQPLIVICINEIVTCISFGSHKVINSEEIK